MIRFPLRRLALAALLIGLAAAAPAQAPVSPARAAFRPYFEQRWVAGTPVTVAQVRRMIAGHGATWAVQHLAAGDSPNGWDSVTRGIASGAQAWLDLAPVIGTGTDAATAEVYAMALSDALIGNAAGVLQLIGDGGDFALCQENGIETEPAHARAYYAAAIEAVEAVRAPALQEARSACLARLRDAAGAPAE